MGKVATLVDRAAATNCNSGPPPITYSSIIHTSECGRSAATACDAIYHKGDAGAADELFLLLVRTNGGGYYNSRGIYECQYTIASTGEVVLTTAVLKPEEGSTTAGRVSCTPPVQDPNKTKHATWSASVGLVEGGFAVPRVNAAGEAVNAAPALLFASHGPVIVGIAEEIMYNPTKLEVLALAFPPFSSFFKKRMPFATSSENIDGSRRSPTPFATHMQRETDVCYTSMSVRELPFYADI